MVIYVKECAAFSLKDIKLWIKNEIDVKVFKSITEVTSEDFIIVSIDDKEMNLTEKNIIIYEIFFKKISCNIMQEFDYNHDYYYLKNALLYAEKPNITSLISGSSYGVFGIDMTLIKAAVNLSSISQDLYYSQILLKLICEKNTNIKNIVLCVGYYYFFSDLSKTQNPDELSRISKVYKPLLNDIHNCILLPPSLTKLYESNIIDVRSVLDVYARDEYLKGFFHKKRPRKYFASKEWEDKTKDWIDLNEDEKMKAGERRATLHNKSIKRESSLKENVRLFNDFVDFCTNNKINLLLVVTPFTTYYRKFLDPTFKTEFYHVINEVAGTIHLLDLSDNKMFADSDFNDTDHLNDFGAKKLTLAIVDTLKTIENG